MARQIKFVYEKEPVAFEMEKVDRTKLYGSKSLEVVDEDGHRCRLITLAADGRSLIGKGGTGTGQIDADGNWIEKTEMKPVDLSGNTITPVKSSFSAEIELDEEASPADYLNHKIRLTYRLESEEFPQSLKQRLDAGAIFKFDYSYRGGLEADAGFLLNNDQDQTFLLIGDPSDVSFKGLQEASVVIVDEEDSGGDDAMDFGMI